MYVCVPNLDAWGFRAFGGAWFPLRLPWHLAHFTEQTLRRAVERAGLAVEAVATGAHSNWMGYSVERAGGERPSLRYRIGRVKLARSALARWSRWRGAGDELCLLARKKAALIAPARRAA
jgi:hypothetical protein